MLYEGVLHKEAFSLPLLGCATLIKRRKIPKKTHEREDGTYNEGWLKALTMEK